MKKKNKLLSILIVTILLSAAAPSACAHCEIPCGIYGDAARFADMREDVNTIEKSMKSIIKLSGEQKVNYNQLVRWVTNKDDHVNRLYKVVTQYFMTQRIKPVDPSLGNEYKVYVEKVTILHQMLYYGMKCKQTTDLKHVKTLRKLIDKFEVLYFKDKKSSHTKTHHH